MKKLLALIMVLMPLTMAKPALAALHIFACEPEWAALAEEIGGDKIEVTRATNARQDVHHIQAKPSLMAGIRQADMVFCTGAELEIGWLPILLTQAGNSKIQPGNEASFMAADYVRKLEVPARLDRADGDVHPAGNPHIQTDPRNIAVVAKALADKLAAIDPANAAFYQARYQDFAARWQDAMARWEREAAPLHGMKIAVQHEAWAYLVDWLKLDVVAALEPKPGVPPTSGYLAEVLEKVQRQPVKAVIYASFEDDGPSQWLHQKTGVPAVALPFTVGGDDAAKDLFGLFDSTMVLLLKAQSVPLQKN
ncbi:MAG: zinc ABC transporter substrate-binding protein [Alphaproteobacteria bacterium]